MHVTTGGSDNHMHPETNPVGIRTRSVMISRLVLTDGARWRSLVQPESRAHGRNPAPAGAGKLTIWIAARKITCVSHGNPSPSLGIQIRDEAAM